MNVFEEANQLSRVPLFSKLDKGKLKLIAFTSEQLSLADQEFLFHQGDCPDFVFLILEGTVQLVIEDQNDRVDVVLERGRNELIGELGVISKSPRSASIRASGPVKLMKIEADYFMTLLIDNPAMSLYVMKDLAVKLNSSLAREMQRIKES